MILYRQDAPWLKPLGIWITPEWNPYLYWYAVFAENAFQELKDSGAKIITCNTIPHKSNNIDAIYWLFNQKLQENYAAITLTNYII
jgi:hypothetical protein